MAATLLCEDQDVILRLGGEGEARKLGNVPLGTLVTSATCPQLLIARQDATAEVQAAFGSRWQIFSANDQAKLLITGTTAWIAVSKFWVACAGGNAMPEHLRREIERAQSRLSDFKRPDQLFGSNPDPPGRYPRFVDNSDGGRRMTYGTCRHGGFLGRRGMGSRRFG